MEITDNEGLRLDEVLNTQSISRKQVTRPITQTLQKRPQKNLNDQLTNPLLLCFSLLSLIIAIDYCYCH